MRGHARGRADDSREAEPAVYTPRKWINRTGAGAPVALYRCAKMRYKEESGVMSSKDSESEAYYASSMSCRRFDALDDIGRVTVRSQYLVEYSRSVF